MFVYFCPNNSGQKKKITRAARFDTMKSPGLNEMRILGLHTLTRSQGLSWKLQNKNKAE